jgi:two-component system OmpR family response regulator
MTRPCVLVVEDDTILRTAMTHALSAARYDVVAAPDASAALDAAAVHHPDLILLDVGLPDGDGFSLARQLSRTTAQTPVMFVTARDAVRDRLTGFDLGADDYIVKPFVLAELLARVAVTLRRSGRLGDERIRVADLVIDLGQTTVSRAGEPIDMTATEFRLLAYLATQNGRTLSKTQLLRQVWGYAEYDPNLVEVHVSAVRRKLETRGPRLLHTVRGLGYTLRAVA